MSIRPEVQEELRQLFRHGATPSRLIQHLAARHRGDDHLHYLIQVYFLETFGVPIVRSLDPQDNYRDVGMKYHFLNNDVLYEMLQAKGTWNQDATEPSWFDPLKATTHDEQLRAVSQQPYFELARVWDKLDDRERAAIQRVLANFIGLSERVSILARLAERLQQRVNELEAERAAVSESELASKNGE
jgi:hypothetical protein